MRKLLWLLALAFPMAGAVDNARVLGVTPTQAVIAYTAPSSAACTLEVSESASYTPLVHDIDTALFASSNADSRAGNVNIGKSRTFVVGQRTVGTASDGKRYSRALQADTVHYFRVTCGADTAAGTFRTANIPLGNSRSDALLADPSSAGEYLWLTPNWVDRTGKYIDPQTGVLVRNVSLPRDATSSSDRLNQTFTSASGAAWTNSSNALADDASAATYSGSASDWMVLLKNNLSPYSTHVVDYIQVQIKGSGAGATAADRTIQACLTSDGGTTCDGDTLEIALDSTESIKTLGSSTPIYTWRPLSRVNLNTADITNNPNFGVRIRKKSASTDQISIQYAELDVYLSIRFAVSSGGDFAMFTENVTGNGFYHVGTQGAGGASSGIYAVHGETGETRWLGSLTFFSGGMKYCVEDNILWHATDPNIIYCQPASDGRLFKGTLTGNDAEAAQNSDVSATWTQVGSDTISNLIRAFYNAHSAEYEVVYDPAKYACGVQGIQNNYAMLVCRRWIQDSYGWLAVMDLTTEAIVALMPQFNCAAGRWCGQHAYDNPGHINLWYDTTHFLQGGNTGLGKYQTKLAAAITATSQTSIMVESASLWNGAWGSAPADGEPVSQYNDHYLQPMKVGDVFMIGSEYVRVTTKTSASSWVVSRGEFGSTPATYAVGAVLDAFCANTNTGNKYNTATHTVWKFLDDPYGKDTSGSTLWTNHYIGHLTARGHRIINSFNLLAIGTEGEDILNTPDPVYNYSTGSSARFAGKYAPHEGNTYQTHPTMHQTKASAWERNWALDVRPFIGGNLVSYTTEGCTPTNANYPAVGGCVAARVSGTSDVYKYTLAGSHNTDGLNRKELATFGVCGTKILRDISGPSSSITDADDYTFCVAHRANECRTGASAGDMFLNCPGLTKFYCTGGEGYGGNVDACLSDVPLSSVGPYQIGMVPNKEGLPSNVTLASDWGIGYHRLLSTYMSGYRTVSGTANAKASPNGKWLVTGAYRTDRSDVVIMKVPPFGPKDSVARDTFVRVPVGLKPPAGVDNVVVEFGYDTSFRCTTRDEACVKDATVGEPYVFAGDMLTGISCASGCTVEIPGIAGRVLYYRWKYRDSANSVIAESDTIVAAL